ncbi:type VI secretion system protein [Planctobacterium marinum]|uniref:type VI secretion system protein n=1 Tax=Planctobacterium marinum TaxID=1631968 RepID=UPI001E5E9156|nr:type VI secretion system protein [Planctobacterium marinum]MCC2604022.1 type VI secretion system protein [Planctobacterium marinum]
MNLNELKRMFNKLDGFFGDYNLIWLLILLIVVVFLIILASGKQIKIVIPFLPRGFNRISFSRDDLFRLKKKADDAVEERKEGQVAKPKVNVVGGLVNAVQLLSGGHEKRYKLPTYLMISGGDTTPDRAMLSELESVLGKKEQRLLQKKDDSDSWYLFQQGCVVHHENTAQIVSELKQFRPERPLDGVIITLPISKFVELDKLELENWATEIYQSVWQTQQKVGFILPVYLVVTGAEKLQGFDAFWSQDRVKRYINQQFGWANPYNDSQPYQSSWITEAISAVSHQIRSAQMSIISHDKALDKNKPTEALLLANSLDSTEAPLTIVCNELFGSTALQMPLMFRGVYFTGQNTQRNADTGDTEKQFICLQELFEQKIFAENRLAFPPQNKLLSSNSRLRAYQYTSIITFGALTTLLVMDTMALNAQTTGLVRAIENEPKIEEVTGLTHVNRVLDHIGSMDASEINYLSMPLSWHNSFNDRIMDYFSSHVFGEVVFPAFQCKMQSKIQDKLNNIQNLGSSVDFSNWLNELSVGYARYDELSDLITNDHQSSLDTERKITDIVGYLYDTKLPDSFYEHSSLYIRAISNKNNDIEFNTFCDIKPLETPEQWNKIMALANQEIAIIAREVVAPKDFFELSAQLQSLPTVISWYNKIPEFAQSLKQYNQWLSHLKNYWLTSHASPNECMLVHDSLLSLSDNFGQDRSAAKQFLESCQSAVSQVMDNDNQSLYMKIYANTDYPMTLNQNAEALFASVEKTNALSYMDVVAGSDYVDRGEDFFWSTEQLNRALELYDEYVQFANTEYQSVWLPNKKVRDNQAYFAQGIALKQLQFAMNRHVLQAQIEEVAEFRPESLRPVSQQEAYLSAAVGNFRKSMDSILALLLAYQKLEFEESHAWLLKLSQDHAFKLLERVDKLYRDNRIFTPLQKPKWSAHQYNAVLFGINGDGQLQDYLSAQAERANNIAFEYAEPLVVFLLNTKGKYVNYELFGKWQNTLIELNKQQNKDPSNSLEQLNQFMSNQLAVVDQSNCFATTAEMVVPEGSDAFSLGHKNIINRAIQHCNSFKADQIKKEYAQISALFTELLADKAPFTRKAKARNVSPKVMREFLEQYSPLANGLVQRMAVLAWKDKAYKAAQDFIKELDATALLFENILLASGKDSSGIEIEVEFNVMDEYAQFTEHLSSWTFASGAYQSSFPGTSTMVFWTPNDPVMMSLKWATQSPYRGFAIDGRNSGQGELNYRIDDIWGLLSFINTYKANEIDSESLVAESRLLKFEASVSAKSGQHPAPQPNVMRAFARFTVYGVDPESKQKIALSIPEHFPEFAPQVLKGSN